MDVNNLHISMQNFGLEIVSAPDGMHSGVTADKSISLIQP